MEGAIVRENLYVALILPQESRIIGYDHLNMQPKLANIPHLKHLAERVQWVHGNMYAAWFLIPSKAERN